MFGHSSVNGDRDKIQYYEQLFQKLKLKNLRAIACKYGESDDRLENLDFLFLP